MAVVYHITTVPSLAEQFLLILPVINIQKKVPVEKTFWIFFLEPVKLWSTYINVGEKYFRSVCVVCGCLCVCIQAVETLSFGSVCHFALRHYMALWGGQSVSHVGLGSKSFIGISVLEDWRFVRSALICVICNLFARSCRNDIKMHKIDMLKFNKPNGKILLGMQANKITQI